MLLLLLLLLVIYLLILYFGFIKKIDFFSINLLLGFIICSIFFLALFIPAIVLLICGCFETWDINNSCVYSKKLFKKTIIIKFNEIVSIKEEIVPALILGLYETNAIVIESSSSKIIIYLNKKITAEYISNLLNMKFDDK